jgi:hypothetical protein
MGVGATQWIGGHPSLSRRDAELAGNHLRTDGISVPLTGGPWSGRPPPHW